MINSIFTHRTIRKYSDKPVEIEKLNTILEAASRASNTGNMQVYSIIVTQSQELKNKLWEAHFKQDMVKKAPVILTFCADFNRFSKWCVQRNAEPGFDNFLSFYTAGIDALLAAQNATLAAEELDLGVCYLGTTTYMAHKIIEILNIPKNVVPVTSLVVGYADELPPLTDRLPVKGIIHSETYHDYSPEDIDSIYFDKEQLSFVKELIEINKVENLAQIFTQKRYTKNDNVLFSKKYLEVIYNQGFMNNDL